jgi:hypothetical protein
MEESKATSSLGQGAVQSVFADFILRLKADHSIEATVTNRLEEALEKGHFSADRLRAALFAEESL